MLHKSPLNWFFVNREDCENIADIAFKLIRMDIFISELNGEFYEKYSEEIWAYFKREVDSFKDELTDCGSIGRSVIILEFIRDLVIEHDQELKMILQLHNRDE